MRLKMSLQRLTERFAEGSLSEAEIRALRRDPRQGARNIWKQHQTRLQAEQAEVERLHIMLTHERDLWERGAQWVAGVDEVGAGPLAGPVVAAAVILPKDCTIARMDDSKKLLAPVRAALAQEIRDKAVAWAIGSCSAQEIDTLNVLRAAIEAMRRAVCALQVTPQHVLVDARRIPRLPMGQTALIKGDSLSHSIAAASILAKVHRDALMHGLDATYPGYGFAQHVGYSTAFHMAALQRLGPCPEHRRSFSPVAQALGSIAPASNQAVPT